MFQVLTFINDFFFVPFYTVSNVWFILLEFTFILSAANELHHEFPMIKYARGGRSIPHERVFKLDNDNLVRNKSGGVEKV